MGLQTSGAISMAQIRAELGLTGTISLNDATVRKLLKKTSGVISLADAYGKANAVVMTCVSQPYQDSNNRISYMGYNNLGSVKYGSLNPKVTADGFIIENLTWKVDDMDGWVGAELHFLSPPPANIIGYEFRSEAGVLLAFFDRIGSTAIFKAEEAGSVVENLFWAGARTFNFIVTPV